ncbi:MAG: hypothetical protein JWP81_3263 [Ferruginibacter sp.]|nr:hypothetical protein [Ferruginibacter sp.]
MNINKKIFRSELDIIQQRNSMFFPVSQKRFVKLYTTNESTQLVFTKNCDLDNAIRLEIMLAFKFSQENDLPVWFICRPFQGHDPKTP